VAETTGQVLPVYGADLFRDVPSTFSPSGLGPVSADYVVGPEDELRVRIWGQVTFNGNLSVDRTGDVYLPGVGTIHVAGLPFSALDQHLRSAVGRVYRNFDLSVDLGKIRSIQIYVAGQARRPGAYTVSSLSSLVDAIFASGGPSRQGSLRHLQLKRNGRTVTDFDLYSLLIFGDKSKDIRLLPEDVLYIPPVGSQVAVLGSVHNPAIYELLGNESIADLLDVAGKTTAVVSNSRISIERVTGQQHLEAMEVGMDPEGLGVKASDGDIVRVYSIMPAYRKTITLRGDVANPGRFGWHDGMRLSDLIPDKDSLLSRDYWWKRSHLGLPSPEFEPLISKIGRDPYALDSSREGFTSAAAQDALTAALRPDSRESSIDQGTSPGATASENRQTRGVTGGSLASQVLEASRPGQVRQNTQSSANQLSPPERTEVRLAAPEIDWSYAVIERIDPNTLKTSLIPFDLGKLVIQHDVSQDLVLQAGDTITVFSQADIRVPLEQQTKYVQLEGEFLHAGVYSVSPGETLQELIRRAGGLTGNAYLYGAEFDRESTRILQQQRIDEYVNRVELDAARGTLAISSSATSSANSVASTNDARANQQELFARLRQIRATGRIVLQVQPDSKSIEKLPALSLENGDRFIVPSVPATINVVGAVNDQNSFQLVPHGTAGKYLALAGGPDRDADRSRTFVIRADGSVVGRQSVKNLWGNGFNELPLNPGDTIVVPEKTLRPTALRGLLDWTQIFSQLALGAAAVNILR
jgi:protein involved in polysaccharide export with SLBB domain